MAKSTNGQGLEIITGAWVELFMGYLGNCAIDDDQAKALSCLSLPSLQEL